MADYGSQPLSFGTQGDSTLDFSDYELLKKALQNEKAAPEILPYEDDLVQRIYVKLEQQEQEIHEAETSPDHELMRIMLTLEVTRVRYMMRSYLRTRLFKVERYALHCLDNHDVQSRLSELEHQYAVQYAKLLVDHLQNSVTSKLPEAFASVFKQASAHATNDMIPAPDLGRHVFALVLRDLGQVQVYEDGGMHELNKGDLYIMRYNVLRPLLSDGSVQLI